MKFSQLNVVLKFMLTTTIDLPQHKRVFEFWNNDSCLSDIHETYKSDTNIIKLKQIRELHLELIKCAKNINDAYGLHILMSISTSFILIIAVSYSQYYFMKSTDYDQHIFPLCSFFYWNFHNAFKIWIVCYVCSSTATEATNTGDILCEMHEPSTSMEFRQEVYNFTLQLVQNPLSFNACGFFDLNNRLIYGVIGGITTYLVILIQIGGIPIQIFYTNSTESTNY
ncbi:PREDICTED: gustatory and pheromone receptor 32a-like [Polistes canadensis]|uniref:gustatory and pheromone receptor 32a-like n=1 Tax=Polistes canadensis TaxID=91411 RepID=UPI000718E459|nr:PREDICTED: gustatory and pheromone receptor 32a-like [Polistes canadensis]